MALYFINNTPDLFCSCPILVFGAFVIHVTYIPCALLDCFDDLALAPWIYDVYGDGKGELGILGTCVVAFLCAWLGANTQRM